MQAGLSPWKGLEAPSHDFLNALRELLPNETSWGEVEEFKSEGTWGSDLRIWWEEGILENIEFRFSPAADSLELLHRFAGLVRVEGYLLVDRKSGQVFEPIDEELKPRLASSRAARFLSDPMGVIIEASKDQASRRENA